MIKNQEDLNLKVEEALKSRLFEEPLPSQWRQAAIRALMMTAPINMAAKASEIRDLHLKLQREETLSLWDFATASNNVEIKSFQDLNGVFSSFSDYLIFMEEANNLVAKWNDYAKEVKDQITAEFITDRKGAMKAIPE